MFGLGPLFLIVLFPLVLSCYPLVLGVLQCCSAVVFADRVVVCGGVNCVRYSFPHFRLCVRCHGVVGLGVCLCDRVTLLWNGGDGL